MKSKENERGRSPGHDGGPEAAGKRPRLDVLGDRPPGGAAGLMFLLAGCVPEEPDSASPDRFLTPRRRILIAPFDAFRGKGQRDGADQPQSGTSSGCAWNRRLRRAGSFRVENPED